MSRIRLTLFVCGPTSRSTRAIANLRALATHELAGKCDVVVVDVLDNPALAEEARILATPTLVRWEPEPIRRIVGDLSDTKEVLAALALAPDDPTTTMEDL